MTDQELLHEYARNSAEPAFDALVRRHIDWVYSAARRIVVDAHLAEDVTQAVFVAAAKAAPKLEHCRVVSAWLHQTTRNLAGMTVRSEVRRRNREREAVAMNQDKPETDPGWERIGPELDQAMGELRDADRAALLLRYFERKTAKEIGARLGLSEEAAQKRVARALEQLRRILLRRGVSSPAGGLAGILSLEVVRAAPTGLAAAVTASSLAVATSTSTSGIITLMASTAFKFALASVITAGFATAVLVERRANAKLRAELAAREGQTVQTPIDRAPPMATLPDAQELADRRAEHDELLRLRGEIAAMKQLERERLAQASPKEPTTAKSMQNDFISAGDWKDVGAGTPQNGFQSFLATLKSGDSNRIESAVHWDLHWKEDLTDEDRAMMAKSRQDYLEMLQQAPGKLSAFSLAPPGQGDSDRTRVFFKMMTTDGTQIDSSFEMARLEGQWKPVISLGWHYPKDPSSFFTSPVFGPSIDLAR